MWNFLRTMRFVLQMKTHVIYKFHHEFEQTLYKIISEGGALNYTLILEDTTEKIRLK